MLDPTFPLAVPEKPLPGGTTGRRLALANWLTDPRHPLTARVGSEMAEYGSDRHDELVIAQMLAGIRSAAQSTE